MTVLLPIVTPGFTTVLPPIQTLSPIRIYLPYSGCVLRTCASIGCPAV